MERIYKKEADMEIDIKELEETIKEAYNNGLNEGVRKHRHLCSSCSKEIPTCESTPEFGDGFGNDNVCDCDVYIKKDAQNTGAPK